MARTIFVDWSPGDRRFRISENHPMGYFLLQGWLIYARNITPPTAH